MSPASIFSLPVPLMCTVFTLSMGTDRQASKQCRSWSDAAERGAWSGSTLSTTFIQQCLYVSSDSKDDLQTTLLSYEKFQLNRDSGFHSFMDSLFPRSILHFMCIRAYITKTRVFKYIEHFTSKNWKNSDKKLWYFSYFCSKHKLWYSLEPPRQGGSDEYPQSMFLNEIRKIMYTPVNPCFTMWKWGLRGSELYRHVFVMFVGQVW